MAAASGNTTSEKVSALFIGFFTFLGTTIGVVFLLFVASMVTSGAEGVPPWLKSILQPAVYVSPVLGAIAGIVTTVRYLHSARRRRSPSHH